MFIVCSKADVSQLIYCFELETERIVKQPGTEYKQVYLLTPMDRAMLLHVTLTISHCPSSLITRQ